MKRLNYLPNLLSSVRITLAPAMLGAAYSNAKIGFAVLLATGLVTDAVDGSLARRWRAESELGRRLDRWGDGLTMIMAATGVFFLWPHIVEQQWEWVLVALAGYALVGLQRWSLPADAKSRPPWWVKALSFAVPVSLVPLVLGTAAWPFHVAAVVQVALGLWKAAGVVGRPAAAPAGS